MPIALTSNRCRAPICTRPASSVPHYSRRRPQRINRSPQAQRPTQRALSAKTVQRARRARFLPARCSPSS
eukprot:925985-Pleurochrysis_carterae.AAC.1